jgi:hypothetical protein
MCDVLSKICHSLLNVLKHPEVFLTLLFRSVSDTSLNAEDMKCHKKMVCSRCTSIRQGASDRVQIQDPRRWRHRRAREECGDVSEDRVGGVGGGHATGVKLPQRATAQE